MTPITLDEMVVAYKKAKVDLFYASDPRLLDSLNTRKIWATTFVTSVREY